MATPLDGVRILELTTMITGPLAGVMLADLGAEVIKVENPKGGDYFRSFRGGLYSPHFCGYNRNKRSISVDLYSERGREVVLKLVERADVLIENFRPGVMDRFGLSLDTLREVNPRLIYCSITGFGEDGPYKDRPAYDAVAQSVAGIAGLFLDRENPQITGPTIADNMTGIFACYGIQGALYEREKTGVARRVDVNMLTSAVAFAPDPFGYFTQMGVDSDQYTRVRASQSYSFTCGDGGLIAVHLSSQPKFWEALIKSLDAKEVGEDPRFQTRDQRIDNYPEVANALRPVFVSKPRDYWMERLEANDVPFAPINSIPEVFDDPQIKHLDTFFEVTHPTEGSVKGIRRPVWLDGSRDDQPLIPPPALGEHTDEVLSELGYAPVDIEALRKAEAV